MNLKAKRLLWAFNGLPDGATVVEIGCVRMDMEVNSEGFSTVYLAKRAKERNWKFFSVDIDPNAVTRARRQTEHLPVSVQQADGATWLEVFNLEIDGLYLDGAAEPIQAVEQYFAAELAEKAVIVIDDVQGIKGEDGSPDLKDGKGTALLGILKKDGWRVRTYDTEEGYKMAVARR